MADARMNRPLVEYLMDKILDTVTEMARLLLEEVEEYADLVVFGDDLCDPGGLEVSTEMYRRLLRPRHRAIMRFLKEHAGEAKILYPGCGAAEGILQDLIDLGVDACMTAQGSAGGRDEARRLKARYGRQLTLWGGVDAGGVLSSGTPEEVKAEVRRRVEDLAPGGGFVLAPVSHIGARTKPENIIALYEAALEYGAYPLAAT